MIWDEPMLVALEQARQAGLHGDVPIGAVVLDQNRQIIARAANERVLFKDPLAHAEIAALQRAAAARGSWRLDDCTLVVTLEPCTMCAGAIVQARLARLVFGAYDEKAGAVASLWDVVRDPRLPHRVEVFGGVMAQASADLLRQFFAERRRQVG